MSVWYRVEDGRYAPSLDEWERPMGQGRPYIHTLEFRVTRETPQGVWLEVPGRADRFVLRDSRKRFACPTPEEAQESWRARKKAQERILNARLRHVSEVLALEGMQ